MAGQVREVRDDGLVDEAGAAGPGVLGFRVGDHGDEREDRVVGGPLLREFHHVEVGRPAAAPVQDHLADDAGVERVFDDGLDRREARAARDEDDRLVAVLAQEEGAERALEAEDVLLLHRAEHVFGEGTALHVPHVKLDVLVVVGRVGHRVRAPLAVAHDDLEVLTRQELQPFVGRKLQLDDRDVARRALDRLDARRQLLHLDLADTADLAGVDHEIRQGLGAAEECEALLLLDVGQGVDLVRAVVDLSVDDLALAGAARAVAAAVGQGDAGGEGGCENRFTLGDLEGVAGFLDRDFGHGQIRVPGSSPSPDRHHHQLEFEGYEKTAHHRLR